MGSDRRPPWEGKFPIFLKQKASPREPQLPRHPLLRGEGERGPVLAGTPPDTFFTGPRGGRGAQGPRGGQAGAEDPQGGPRGPGGRLGRLGAPRGGGGGAARGPGSLRGAREAHKEKPKSIGVAGPKSRV